MRIPPSGIDTGHWILETFDFGSYASSSFSDAFSVSVEDGSVLHELLLDSSSSLETLCVPLHCSLTEYYWKLEELDMFE